MNCGLIDIACHAKNLALGWWIGLPWWAQLGIVVGIGFMIWGVVERAVWTVRRAGEWLHRIGGWPAVAGAIIAALAVAVSVAVKFLPKKPEDKFTGEVEGKDAKTREDFVFGRKKPARRTAKRAPSDDPPKGLT